jgi:lipoyl(octanoyl) transferase
VEAFGSLRESYRAINRLLLEALRTLGVDAREAQGSRRAPIPGLAPCFEAPVAGEVVAGGRKLVGSAQVRDGDAFLQHGSILIDDDQHLLWDN